MRDDDSCSTTQVLYSVQLYLAIAVHLVWTNRYVQASPAVSSCPSLFAYAMCATKVRAVSSAPIECGVALTDRIFVRESVGAGCSKPADRRQDGYVRRVQYQLRKLLFTEQKRMSVASVAQKLNEVQ